MIGLVVVRSPPKRKWRWLGHLHLPRVGSATPKRPQREKGKVFGVARLPPTAMGVVRPTPRPNEPPPFCYLGWSTGPIFFFFKFFKAFIFMLSFYYFQFLYFFYF
jgi:hypothetical protein